jgi:hypothetical protein
MRLIFGWAASACLLVLLAFGCVAVPPRDGLARVHVEDVVKRVKCDIAKAVLLKANRPSPDGKYPFAFLRGWAAKLHLTIIVDDQASINPGATLITPLPSVQSVSQSYSTGIGVGLTTEAVRTEDLEFLMSFSDLEKEFANPANAELYRGCNFDDGVLLESDLGLGALIDSALEPIEHGVLKPGNNIGPGAAPPPATQPSGRVQLSALEKSQKEKPSFKALLQEEINRDLAKDIETRTQAIINNVVKPLYGIATTSSFSPKCLATVTKNQNEAIVYSINVSRAKVQVDQNTPNNKPLDDEKKYFKQTVNAANDMISSFKTCTAEVQKKKPKEYDPIDVISETVNFYITGSGSVTPTWKLVHVTAPLAGTFASASRKDTNTLILSMGRPILAADGSITASQTMNNQILAALLNQVLSQRPTQ